MAQELQTTNADDSQKISTLPDVGRLVALDPGTKRIGIAVCDELQMIPRPLKIIDRSSWKKLLLAVKEIISEFDAAALVIGLPLNSDGSESEMSEIARELTRKFDLSLEIPVFLQDERITSYEAHRRVWQSKRARSSDLVDSEAASIILEDFLDRVRKLKGP